VQEPGRVESSECVLEPFRCQSGESVKLLECKLAGQIGIDPASPGVHLMGGEPDAEVD
jgi:hypothetical protein